MLVRTLLTEGTNALADALVFRLSIHQHPCDGFRRQYGRQHNADNGESAIRVRECHFIVVGRRRTVKVFVPV